MPLDTPALMTWLTCASTALIPVIPESCISNRLTSIFAWWQCSASLKMGTHPKTGPPDGQRLRATQLCCLLEQHTPTTTEHSSILRFLDIMLVGGYMTATHIVIIMEDLEVRPIRSGFDFKVQPGRQPQSLCHQPPPHPQLLPRLLLLLHQPHAWSTCSWGTTQAFSQLVRRMARVYRIVVCTAIWRRMEEAGCCSTPTAAMRIPILHWMDPTCPRHPPLGTLTGISAQLSDTPVQTTWMMCASTAALPGIPEWCTLRLQIIMSVKWQYPAAMEVATSPPIGTLDGLPSQTTQQLYQQMQLTPPAQGHSMIIPLLVTMDLGLSTALVGSAMISEVQEPTHSKSGSAFLRPPRYPRPPARQQVHRLNLLQQSQLLCTRQVISR
mmetsp:Transcript_23860/g.45363  ORF Transcript_23860/g.45363 Transcript_23860/m.45363 type:complete len:382 (+) Transcript_23860:900-2045(+)